MGKTYCMRSAVGNLYRNVYTSTVSHLGGEAYVDEATVRQKTSYHTPCKNNI